MAPAGPGPAMVRAAAAERWKPGEPYVDGDVEGSGVVLRGEERTIEQKEGNVCLPYSLRGYSFTAIAERETERNVEEKLCDSTDNGKAKIQDSHSFTATPERETTAEEKLGYSTDNVKAKIQDKEVIQRTDSSSGGRARCACPTAGWGYSFTVTPERETERNAEEKLRYNTDNVKAKIHHKERVPRFDYNIQGQSTWHPPPGGRCGMQIFENLGGSDDHTR